MTRTRTTVVLLACCAALLVAGCVQGIPGTDGRDAPDVDREPGLVDFTSTGAQCTDDFSQNASTSIESFASVATVTMERNVSVPNTSFGLDRPAFDVVNDSTSRLDVPSRPTGKPTEACNGTAYVRYNATVNVPAVDGAWRLRLSHDGRQDTVLFGDSNRSGAGASASAGERVSETDARASGASGGTDTGNDSSDDGTDGGLDGPEQPSQIPFEDLPTDAQEEFRAVLANGSVESDEPPALYEALDLGDDRAHIRYNGSVYEPVVANLTDSDEAAYDYRVTLRDRGE